jgi:hypothetical protein
MKKILGVIVLGLLWANTSFANDHKPNNFDAFVWSDGKKLKIQKGRDIENPENKIIIIFNHGGWGWEKSWGPGWASSLAKLMAPNLSGKNIKGKETVLWMNGSLIDKKNDPFKGKEIGYACGWKLRGGYHPPWYDCVINNFPTYLREKRTKEAIDYFASKGTPRNQIFLSGHSCGAWNALRLKGKYPDAFNSAIAYMPNCWDRKPNGPIRKMLIDEMKTFKELSSISFSSPIDGHADWHSDYKYLKWIGDIQGATMIELPGHNAKNGREISVNGKLCKDLPRMQAGWEETHDVKKKHKGFKPVDKKEMKEMKKKARGHVMLYYSCFQDYYPQILDFIVSKVK